ncbi:phosphatidylinositol-glycan biosynthesis class f protein-related [Holotrichia oblita]|uniref:Phosphatidylinositol-glycan biosynthesis class f protein-related n=1 Tax=Holotrichia oblita TaxID=644536 RepID=A0ACB9T584_HOLOL|nr:phosphatidylinositol-glycan biosynthesis class f protein-related [Holotrichia oblita]
MLLVQGKFEKALVTLAMANTYGLGYNTALDFAKRGARVILACRSKERAEAACSKIIKETGNKNVSYKLIDLTSLQSVRNFAEEFNKTEDRLDILVNNAALGVFEKDYTDDGIQFLLHVNHISPFLLTHLLIGKLKQSAPSRIVTVASLAGALSPMNLDNINKVPKILLFTELRDAMVYGTTKLYNILFTNELARRLDGTGVTVNALHPGCVSTELFRGFKGIIQFITQLLAYSLFMTSEEGAQTQIYLGVSKDVENISGGLFTNCRQIGVYSTAKDPQLAKKLWEISEELAHINPNEKINFPINK